MPHHPKLRRAARDLGCRPVELIGHLACLWLWTLAYGREGSLAGYDAIDVADGAGWTGDPDQLLDVLVAYGWIDRDGQDLIVHDWDDFGGRYERERAKNAARIKRWRGQEPAKTTPPELTKSVFNNVTRTSPLRNALREEENIHVSTDVDTHVDGERRRVRAPRSTHEGFDQFRQAYPPRCPRKNWEQARKAWDKHRPPIDAVLEALAWQDRDYADWQKTDPDGRYAFIEAPAVWLNAHNWERERPLSRGAPAPIAIRPPIDGLRQYLALAAAGQLDGYDPADAERYRAEAEADPDTARRISETLRRPTMRREVV